MTLMTKHGDKVCWRSIAVKQYVFAYQPQAPGIFASHSYDERHTMIIALVSRVLFVICAVHLTLCWALKPRWIFVSTSCR